MALTPTTPLTNFFRLTPIQKIALKRLGLITVEDLLYHFPVRYGDTAVAKSIDSLSAGETAVIFGKITGLKASKGFKSKMTMAEGVIEDETGRIQCIWFNQPYVAKMIPEGGLVRIEGRVSERKRRSVRELESQGVGELGVRESQNTGGQIYFSNPKIEVVTNLPMGVGDSLFGDGSEAHNLYPVYPESRGITSSWIYHALNKLMKAGILEQITEPLPAEILEKYHLPTIKTALVWIHTPMNRDDALSARKRFSFEEIFIIQLGRRRLRKIYENQPGFKLETDDRHVQEFIRRFPFAPTGAQMRAIEIITAEMKGDRPMSRLLEGDVGSGKTAVAAATAYAVMVSRPPSKKTSKVSASESENMEEKLEPARIGRFQTAFMCPTEILAIQHFESFIKFFSYMPVQIALITGSGCRKFPSKVNPKGWTDISRTQLLQWVANGEISVVVGTHALIQNSVVFKNLAYVIIDEQHRFGVNQRAKLVKKAAQGRQEFSDSPRAGPSSNLKTPAAPAPHLLSMTATPIPRTLALTLYGDLDLTLLDQLPAGRKPVITELVLPDKRLETYEKIRLELQAGRQMYVICPRIDEPDPEKEAAIIARSVTEEARRLKQSVFPEYVVGVLHGKMKPKEKDEAMKRWSAGVTRILCATSVVEVGVNVPNATIIVIEGAERFGLAQLHQLRGRVMRSAHQAYCYAFTETSSAKSIERLKALQTAKDGFELAELDLSQRGAGELSGMKQWGVSDVAMEALKNLKMVEAARTEATRLIEEDIQLTKYPELASRVNLQEKSGHME